MKKFLCLLAVLLPLAGVPSFAQTPQIHGESVVLYDALTGDLLFSRAERQRRGMASTTKIMTALVALEQYDPEAEVEIRQEWCGVEGSSMYLRPGERLTVSDLLYGLLLESGNDAAQALAGLDPHGPEAFVDKMNAKAQDLSLSDTQFCNPSGAGSGASGGGRTGKPGLCPNRCHPQHHTGRPHAEQPQPAFRGDRRLRRQNGLYHGLRAVSRLCKAGAGAAFDLRHAKRPAGLGRP